jgi:hypothetical protein
MGTGTPSTPRYAGGVVGVGVAKRTRTRCPRLTSPAPSSQIARSTPEVVGSGGGVPRMSILQGVAMGPGIAVIDWKAFGAAPLGQNSVG